MTVFSTQDKNKAMPQKKLLVIGLFSLTVALSGCATDGNYYRSDVYSSSQVNQAQRVNTVEIIAINPAQVAVNNSENSDRARATGAILGAIAGGSDTYLGKGKAGTLDAKLSRLTKWIAAVFVLLTLFVALLGSL